MKKLIAFVSAISILTIFMGLAYYFFKLNPEYNPFRIYEDELD